MDPIKMIFGDTSEVEIYGGEFRSVVGSYIQHTDVEVIDVNNGSNITHVTINESVGDDGTMMGGAGDRHCTAHSNDSASGEEQLNEGEFPRKHKQRQVTISNSLFNPPPPIGLTPKAKNLYQLLMVSASNDQQRHGSNTLPNTRPNIPTPNVYLPVNAALSSSSFTKMASGIPSNPGVPLYVPNLGALDTYNGKLVEEIHTSTTTNSNSGTVFNASAISDTSISYTDEF